VSVYYLSGEHMETLQYILQNDLALLFIILTFGCLLGKLSVSGMNLSASGGVLFVAMAFGHFQITLPDQIGTFGFALFIYSIGFGAGPRFFQTFRRNGIKFIFVSLFVIFIASGTAFTCLALFDLSPILLPGILAGALTSTSTLAAAYEVSKDPSISVGYGITYPFGLLGLLILIQFLPRLMHVDLKEEAHKIQDPDSEEENEINNTLLTRVYSVQNSEIEGKSLRELNIRKSTGILVLTIKHGNSVIMARADSVLHVEDHILAEGRIDDLINFEHFIGQEIMDDMIYEHHYRTAPVVINKKYAVNRSISDLKLAQKMDIIVTRIQRGSIDLGFQPDIALERGDIITITGMDFNVRHAIALMGRQEHKIYETDIFTFNAGLVLGLLLGMVKLPFINTSIGIAGGLLIMGILLGYLRNFGPFSGRVPIAARYILQEIGLLLFLACIGLKAGEALTGPLCNAGFSIFITGVLITTITLVTTVFFCHFILKFDWNTSFGATTGGVTSSVALEIVTDKAESDYAILGYAGVYAFANILLTILGQVMVMLV